MATQDRDLSSAFARGFTIIELMIGLVIIGMGMTIAVPSFQEMLARNTMATQVNEFMLSLLRARSEASKTGSIVSILGQTAATDYTGGWCIARGASSDCSTAVIMAFPPMAGETTLSLVGGTTPIRFNSLGGLQGGAAIDVDMCHVSQPGRRIHISLVGRAKAHKSTAAFAANDPRLPAC